MKALAERGQNTAFLYCDFAEDFVLITNGVCEIVENGCDSRGDCPFNPGFDFNIRREQ